MLEKILTVTASLNNDDFIKLANKIDAMRKERAKKLLAEARAAAAKLDGSALTRKFNNSVFAEKYRDPRDNNNVWSGRGRPPVWFNQRLEEGFRAEDMLIR